MCLRWLKCIYAKYNSVESLRTINYREVVDLRSLADEFFVAAAQYSVVFGID